MFKSIRWQLPLSYAAIALLAALALGVVLLITLRGYYQGQELDYLSNNAQQISQEMARMVQADLPPAAVQAQLNNFSFLSQARVRLLDPNQQPLADSGEPAELPQVAALSVEVEAKNMVPADVLTQPLAETLIQPMPSKAFASFIYIQRADFEVALPDTSITRTLVISRTGDGAEVFQWQISPVTTDTDPITGGMATEAIQMTALPAEMLSPPDFISVMPAVNAPYYGFSLSTKPSLDGPRSAQIVSQPFYGAEGQLLGYAEISQGPAYGREILTSVAWGWALAGGIAVLLAAGAGWLLSRRLSTPLLALTEVTGRMAQGDLSARADTTRPAPAEVGVLAHSFNQMAEQVEETVQTLRRFVADAAHELHTPLTALRTNLELLQVESGAQGQVEQAQTQVSRLEKLTRDLLDLSRLETGAERVNFGPVILTALVQELGEVYASRAEQAGLTFTLELPGQPLTVPGHESQLRQAVSNLLDNALKFTPAGGEVRLSLVEAGDWAEVQVADSGIGIPPGDLPHLFSRFHRGRNAAGYPGSGLGLAIVKIITEGHGGQVTVENNLPGARFRLRLPLLKIPPTALKL